VDYRSTTDGALLRRVVADVSNSHCTLAGSHAASRLATGLGVR
jgi:hypothetical protein